VKIYNVSLKWSCGTVTLNLLGADSPEAAAAVTAWTAMRSANPPRGDLAGTACVEVDAETLREALMIAEGGAPRAVPVLTLVPLPQTDGVA
jgi:hypothetical protein